MMLLKRLQQLALACMPNALVGIRQQLFTCYRRWHLHPPRLIPPAPQQLYLQLLAMGLVNPRQALGYLVQVIRLLACPQVVNEGKDKGWVRQHVQRQPALALPTKPGPIMNHGPLYLWTAPGAEPHIAAVA